MVLLKYHSSIQDESIFQNPQDFDSERANVKRHVAFGFGTHVCIGQHLSRLEMTIAWEVLFDTFSEFEMAQDPRELLYMPNIMLRGLEEIAVVLRR